MTRRQKLYLAITAVVAYWASAAPAEQQFAPEAAAILDRYVEAAGGKAAHARIQSRETKIRMEISGSGIVFSGTIISARPNLNYTLMESEPTGRIERGTDGKVVWSNSVTTGPQRLEGRERDDFLYQTQMDRLADWRKFHSSAALDGAGEVDGRACKKVKLTPNGAPPQTLCFDVESGLLTGTQMEVRTPGGDIAVSVSMSDYREVDGVKMPFLIKTRLAGQERVTTVEKVVHNLQIPEGRFAPPASPAAGR